ncbi:MAG: T9SS type A sorting domain-containing protein, partial [Ignavibacteria bacterium]|nr:T9SS type A sorting domain-containing protein [Ignavibacteria bacterium]
LLIVSCSLFSQTGWFPCNTGTNNDLTSVSFVDQNTGWVAGYNNTVDYHGVILRSTNGGTNWVSQVDEYNFQPESIYFLDENSGWSTGSRLFGTNRSAVKKTTNSGTTWMNVTIPDTSISTNSVYFIDQNTGWISGRDINNKVKIFKTMNGGLNWTVMETDFISSNPGPKIQFLNSNTGYLAALQLIKTTNGGLNWNISDLGSNVNASQPYFVNANTGWVTGYSQHPAVNYIKKTNDGGNSWVSQLVYPLATGRAVYSTYFINSTTGWSAGSEYVNSSLILKTTNSGVTWSTQTSQAYTNSLSSIFFINENYGWSVGTNGRMLRTTDGGGSLTAFETISSSIPKSYSLKQNYPNPFNPVTYIEFSIPETGFVKLSVFSSIGREIGILVNEQLQPGIYRTQFEGSRLPSGVYFYTLNSKNYMETKKLVLIK